MTQEQENEMYKAAGLPPVNSVTKVPEKSFAERYGLAPQAAPIPAQPTPSFMDTVKTRANAVIDNPMEAAKGVVKGAVSGAVGLTKIADMGITAGGAAMAGDSNYKLGDTMLDYKPIDQMTTPSNDAQAGGANLETIGELALGGKALIKPVTSLVKGVPGAIEATGQALKNTVNAVKNIGIKTDEEILATSADKLGKLTTEQRARWSKLHNDKITELDTAEKQAANVAKDVATKDAKAKITTLKEEAKALDYEFTQKTVEEAQSLKPKVLDAMRKNSDEYRKLVDAEINPVRETYVNDDTIMQSIRNRFPSDPYSPDPYKAERIIKEMGLQEGSTRKVGELYDAMKGEKAALSSGGKTGNKVFTSSDMDRTDKISALSDALKANGVDLKNANEFWKNYAPLRDKIIQRINPFKPEGAENGGFNTFTNMVKNSLAKPDAKNANFIKATEDMLGVKIGNPATRAAFEKLSANQKQIIATAVEKEAKLEAAEAAKDASKVVAGEAKKGVEAKMSKAQQTVDRKKRIVGTIGALIATGGGGAVLYNQLFGR